MPVRRVANFIFSCCGLSEEKYHLTMSGRSCLIFEMRQIRQSSSFMGFDFLVSDGDSIQLFDRVKRESSPLLLLFKWMLLNYQNKDN